MAELQVKDAALFLGISKQTLRSAADRGDIAHRLTPGGHRRFEEAELRRYARRRTTSPRPEGNVARARAWASSADRLLIAASRDLRASPELAEPFKEARIALGRR